jgi:hypothetical protein
MHIVVGPVLTRAGGYAFDAWTAENGLSRGYVYRRIEDANYARNAEIRVPGKRDVHHILACSTLNEFLRATTVLPARQIRVLRRSAGWRSSVSE